MAAHVRRCTEALTRLFTEETGQQQQAITETEQRMVLREQVLASLERIKASAARLDGELGGLRMEYQPQAASVEGIHTA